MPLDLKSAASRMIDAGATNDEIQTVLGNVKQYAGQLMDQGKSNEEIQSVIGQTKWKDTPIFAAAAPAAPAKPEGKKESELNLMRGRLGMGKTGEGGGLYDLIGGRTGMGATAGGVLGAALAPETGGLSLLIPALTAAGGGALGAVTEGKDPLTEGVTSGIGQAAGGLGSKGLQWAGGKLMSRFEMGKYIGKVGEKLSEVFHLPPMKTGQDIYNALNLGTAEKAISDAYKGAQNLIFKQVAADTPIKGTEARFLNRLYYDNVPEYKSIVDAVVANQQPAGFVSKYSSFKKQPQGTQNTVQRALDTMPITIENAMEYAKLLGAYSSAGKGGARGFATREANRDARQTIANVLDKFKPGTGDIYNAMNMDFRRGMTTLSSFEGKELFKETPKGPILNRVEWQKASNDALKKLRDVGAEEVDEAIRLGRPAGFAGTTVGMHGRLGGGGFSIFHPGTWLSVKMENPLRPESRIPNELVRKLLKEIPGAVGANVGAQVGE
jgi:hypothetical protein